MKRVFILSVAMALVVSLGVALGADSPYKANVVTDQPFPLPPAPDCNTADNALANCGFETASFPPWIDTDLTGPFFPLVVDVGGISPGFGFFVSAPTEGTFAVLHGFDGDGATGATNAIRLEQDVTLLGGADNLTFDYRGAWDMTFGATQNRTFEVHIEPSGGGPPMQSDLILTATANTTNLDTGALDATVDISAFAGQAVRIVMEWTIPEDFTGPGFFQVDNVLLNSPVPVELLSFSVDQEAEDDR